ncbi:MAG: methyltransferase [Myxococcota bacterium]|nr:methyltransferase [Myxococcota bacterium]
MTDQKLNPSRLIELATAYWGSATLIAASNLNIFTTLADGPMTAKQMADSLELDLHASDALLTGCVGLDLLSKDGENYVNTPMAEAFLVTGRPGYLGPALAYNGDVFKLWGSLADVVKQGTASQAPEQYLGNDASRTRNFVYGMHHRALGIGQAVASAIDLSGCRHLADVGGGPGTYSGLLTAKHPDLKATVLDLPAVVDIAGEIVASMGASSSVSCQAFDYYTDPMMTNYDAALISGVLHREQSDGAEALITKVAENLDDGGTLYISDVMLDDTRTGPLFGTMFALNMRVLAHNGRCHSVAEQTEWLANAGCTVTQVTQLPAPIHYTVIRAEKKK